MIPVIFGYYNGKPHVTYLVGVAPKNPPGECTSHVDMSDIALESGDMSMYGGMLSDVEK